MADLTTRAGKGSPLTNAEVDANFTNLNTDKVETGLAALDAYDTTISDTAVDVFVYDTSRDSDGGAWRKRTQHTSWYNETLNTATRGSRREFPAVAVIVLQSDCTLTIYDGDDPDLPMWMVFFDGRYTSSVPAEYMTGSTYAPATSLSMANARVVIGRNDSTYGGFGQRITVIDFIRDEAQRSHSNSAIYAAQGLGNYIANRNVGGWKAGFPDMLGNSAVVNSVVNDVAMTVLPDAPIDPATGLPVPTIAVATNGGVSVITDSGAVYDSSKTTAATDATIDGERLRIAFTDSDVLAYDLAPISADGFTGDIYDPATTPALLGTTTTLAKAASGSSAGMTLLAEDGATPANGMIARVTSSYNSGYQNGDIKGAFLSDTDDTDLVEAEEITNGTFDTDLTGWTVNADSSWDASARLKYQSSGVTGFVNVITKGVTLEANTPYVLTFDAEKLNANFTNVVVTLNETQNNSGTNIISSISINNASVGSPKTFTTYFTTGSDASLFLQFLANSVSAGLGFYLDNVSIRKADADRSVNDKSLIVNGTVTRTAVATGADLVAYSGFSAANYLEQPYNSDLDFGTGDFCVMGWAYDTGGASIDTLFSRGDTDGHPWGLTIMRYSSNLKLRVYISQSLALEDARAFSSNVWEHFCVVRSSGTLYLYRNGTLSASAASAQNVGTGHGLNIGNRYGLLDDAADNFSLALLRVSATAPTAEQIAKIYEDEKFLFQEGAQATLYGSSDAVTALAHDEVTDLLHVGTSAGRSVFQGLRRVDNTTDAVGVAISAYDDLVVED